MNVLVFNAGSSSLKYKLIEFQDNRSSGGQVLAHGNEEAQGKLLESAAAKIIDECVSQRHAVDAVGHRLVHGGTKYRKAVVIDQHVLEDLRALRELDPLHNPQETGLIEAAKKALPDVPQVAAFDTGFHASLPEVAWRYALPKQWADGLNLRRYGFHGISYQYIAGRLKELSGEAGIARRAVICHLGSGASVCALLDGASVDTSMGMTPLEGLVMATRCGDLDPGLVLYLLRESKIGIDDLDDLLNHKSGLAGLVEGSGGDTRGLEDASAGTDAEFALESFAYRVRKYIGAYAAALGGLDALVFTGGIGAGSAKIRGMICDNLAYLGIRIDDGVNDSAGEQANGAKISRNTGGADVWVIPTDEELEIARQAVRLISNQSG